MAQEADVKCTESLLFKTPGSQTKYEIAQAEAESDKHRQGQKLDQDQKT